MVSVVRSPDEDNSSWGKRSTFSTPTPVITDLHFLIRSLNWSYPPGLANVVSFTLSEASFILIPQYFSVLFKPSRFGIYSYWFLGWVEIRRQSNQALDLTVRRSNWTKAALALALACTDSPLGFLLKAFTCFCLSMILNLKDGVKFNIRIREEIEWVSL